MMTPDFMGLNNFVWWFGIVENRIDPINLGRCQVRCFGWHTEDTSQITKEDLPWAHPVVPFGVSNIHPPTEGTMVFGFFADGKEARYPIMLGTVPGVPEELREPQEGFSDPWTAAEKASQDFPKRVKSSTVGVNASGPIIVDDIPKRYPSNLNEPTTSRLARPDRVIDPTTTQYLGVRTESIANTTIDYQRKNRATNIKSASGKTWQEPFPSFNAQYPFNNVEESESGHAIEVDDTPDFERVQISHRTGSTIEFLPSGSIKQKSFANKYDVTMGDSKEYVNGIKDETIQSDMFLRINGKLVIQCAGLDLVSNGAVKIQGTSVNITALGDLNLAAKGGDAKLTGAGNVDVRANDGSLVAFGKTLASVQSSKDARVEAGAGGTASLAGTFAVVSGVLCDISAVMTDIASSKVPENSRNAVAASVAKLNKPVLSRTQSAQKQEPTNQYGNREQQKAKINS